MLRHLQRRPHRELAVQVGFQVPRHFAAGHAPSSLRPGSISSRSASRRCARPRWSRLITVPTGQPQTSAISR